MHLLVLSYGGFSRLEDQVFLSIGPLFIFWEVQCNSTRRHPDSVTGPLPAPYPLI